MNPFSNALKKYLKQSEKTLTEICSLTGISWDRMAGYRDGDTIPNARTIDYINCMLGTSFPYAHKEKKAAKSVVEILEAARKEGMSYGKYVARYGEK